MSTYKTSVDETLVVSFLEKHFSPRISDFEVIIEGEGSQAYSFKIKDESYIIRINKHYSEGFKKDEYAFVHYGSPQIPIPKIYEIGNINSDLRFCISQKVEGRILNSFDKQEQLVITPSLFEVLDSIHLSDISTSKGYGNWDSEGNTHFQTWKESLLNVDKYAKGTTEKPGLFETSFLEKDFWDRAYDHMVKLLPFCSEERALIHSDFGFNNALSDGTRITGVIDWESSQYGDFLFDVAWLSFWSSIDYESLYADHCQKKGRAVPHSKERILCYKIRIGLGSMSFFAHSDQREKYEKTKSAVQTFL